MGSPPKKKRIWIDRQVDDEWQERSEAQPRRELHGPVAERGERPCQPRRDLHGFVAERSERPCQPRRERPSRFLNPKRI